MNITEITDRASALRWLAVPEKVYQEDPNWIPHLRQDIEKVFDPDRNKFFREGKCRRWIVLDDRGEAIGRIAAFHWKKYSTGAVKAGGIGFFECLPDAAAARLLLDTACQWLKDEGMQAVDGPINFGEKDAFWGLLVENFTDMSSYRMNYNPPYYRAFFEDHGFQTYYEQWCFRRDMHVPAQDVFARKNDMIRTQEGFRVSHSRGRSIEQLAHDFVTVYNNAWAGYSGFKTMSEQQALNIIRSMKPVMDRDILVFAYMHDQAIGFYLNLPELNEMFRHVHGNLNWWGKLKFLWHLKFSKRHTMVGIIFGVDRAYHGKGVEGAMIKFAEEHIVPLGRYQETIMTWIGDFNPKMLRVTENLGAQRYRTLITFRKMLDPGIPFERYPIVQ